MASTNTLNMMLAWMATHDKPVDNTTRMLLLMQTMRASTSMEAMLSALMVRRMAGQLEDCESAQKECDEKLKACNDAVVYLDEKRRAFAEEFAEQIFPPAGKQEVRDGKLWIPFDAEKTASTLEMEEADLAALQQTELVRRMVDVLVRPAGADETTAPQAPAPPLDLQWFAVKAFPDARGLFDFGIPGPMGPVKLSGEIVEQIQAGAQGEGGQVPAKASLATGESKGSTQEQEQDAPVAQEAQVPQQKGGSPTSAGDSSEEHSQDQAQEASRSQEVERVGIGEEGQAQTQTEPSAPGKQKAATRTRRGTGSASQKKGA
jgi:hypothetical protein